MSGRGLTFFRGRAPVGGSRLPLPGGWLRRACLRKPILGESQLEANPESEPEGITDVPSKGLIGM